MKLTRAEAARWISERNDFCILTHRRPDGDTLGTAALLCLGLRSLGKQAYILENPEITEKYRFLHAGLTRKTVKDFDTVVCVDVASQSMLPQEFSQYAIALRIDHHGSASSFTEHELVDPAAGACGEIVYDVLMEMGVALDKGYNFALCGFALAMQLLVPDFPKLTFGTWSGNWLIISLILGNIPFLSFMNITTIIFHAIAFVLGIGIAFIYRGIGV